MIINFIKRPTYAVEDAHRYGYRFDFRLSFIWWGNDFYHQTKMRWVKFYWYNIYTLYSDFVHIYLDMSFIYMAIVINQSNFVW